MDTQSQAFGAALTGIPVADFTYSKAFMEQMEGTDSGPAKQALAKVAATIFQVGEREDSYLHTLYEKLASTSDWHPGYDRFIEPIYGIVLGEVFEGGLQKSAGLGHTILEKLHNVTGTGVSMTRTALMAALATGIGGGALYNTISRGLDSETTENDALMTRARHYRSLTRNIEEELQRSGATPQTAIDTVMGTYT